MKKLLLALAIAWFALPGLQAMMSASSGVAHAQIKGQTTPDEPPEDDPPPPCQDKCCGSGGGSGGGSGPPGGGPGFGGGEAGDPVSLYDGGLRFSRTDVVVDGIFPIRITRRYDSRTQYDSRLGYGWAFEHDRRLFAYADGSVLIRSGCGVRSRHTLQGGLFDSPRDGIRGELTTVSGGGYELRYRDGARDVFDAQGRLEFEESREGHRHEYLYDAQGKLPLVGTSPNAVDPNAPMIVAKMPQLTRIQERSVDGALTGYAIDFFYNEDTGRVTRITTNDGREVYYEHDEAGDDLTRGNLIRAHGLDNLDHTYTYADVNDPHNLTSLQEAPGMAPVVNQYNDTDRVTKQTHDTSVIDFVYEQPLTRTSYTRRVVDNAGQLIHSAVHTVEFVDGYYTKEINPLGHEYRVIYDARKHIERTEVWQKPDSGPLALHRQVNYTRDTMGRVLTQSATMNGGETITQTWTYDHGWPASEQSVSSITPTKIFRTEYTFHRDSQARPVNIASVKRRNDDGSFATTTYSYCDATDVSAPNSTCPYERQLKAVDGPRTDVNDITTYAYYATTNESGCTNGGACHRKGQAWKITNALGQITEFTRYDRAGRVAQVKDANGVITDLTYHPRGWLLSRIVRGTGGSPDATTIYAYDADGNPTRVTLSDGSYVAYGYDDRLRLNRISDNLGQRIDYLLDSEGNRLAENTYDASEMLTRTQRHAYNSVNERIIDRTAQDQLTIYGYDAIGNRLSTIDPRGIVTTETFDVFNRLTATRQNVGGIDAQTQFRYDTVGNLVQVTDPKGLDTDYAYNTLGQLTELTNPDTGTTEYTYDPAGNRLTQTDARNITATHSYDALNRLTGISYPTSALNVVFAYDQVNATTGCATSSPQGRLTRITDASGQTTYCYDHRGNVIRKTQVTSGTTLTVGYAYDAADRVTGITYPGGQRVAYGRDSLGRLDSLDWVGTNTTALVSNIDYLPFGPANSYAFGNAQTLSKTHDQNYWLTDVASPALTLHFRRDAVGNIDRLGTAPGAAMPIEQYAYDNLYRLTAVRNSAGSDIEAYSYDATGNRLSKVTTAGTETYTYPAINHWVIDIDGDTRDYDAVGNTTADDNGSRTYAYDDRNRLAGVQGTAGIAQYTHNGRGERVKKTATVNSIGSVRLFVHDEAGRLLGDYDAAGQRINEYVWADDVPVAVTRPGTPNDPIHYIHSDQLGTPRAVTNQQGTKVWEWPFAANAFGEAQPNEDPDNDSTPFTLNLRYPGQYFDAESGLHYNYFRDYEASTGRYIESDPIGLGGGNSTYSYGDLDPFTAFDPKGLAAQEKTDEECCDYARGQISANAEGTIACCNGRKILCVWPSVATGAPPGSIIARCRREHEVSHLDDAPCPEGCPEILRVPNRATHECAAYRVEISCLRNRKGDCRKSSVCRQRIEAEIEDRERQEMTWCQGSGG